MKLEVGQETGTLAELNVKPGHVVEWIGSEDVGHLRADCLHDGVMIFRAADGTPYCFGDADKFRIVSRAPQSPVRTVTRKEIVPGVYGRIAVFENDYSKSVLIRLADSGGEVDLNQDGHYFDAEQLTAAIETLTAIRDALA